jgi:hypothetical protein
MAFVLADHHRQRSKSDVSRISVYKNGITASGYSLNIHICLNHVLLMGWVIGERINIFFDDQDPFLIMLKRTPVQGSVLTKGGSKNTGKLLAGDIKTRWLPSMPYKRGDMIASINHQIKDGALIIQFKQTTKGQ